MIPKFIKLPVKYDRKNFTIIDSNFKTKARPWHIAGMKQEDVHALGEFIANAINSFKDEVKESKVDEVVNSVVSTVTEIVKPRRGRPPKETKESKDQV